MNWKERIFKPRWQHRKEHIRAEAVSSSNDPRIFPELGDIAANDESPLVRQNAIARLTGLEQLRSLHKTEPDENIRQFIYRRIRSLLLAPADAGPDVKSRIKFLEHWEDVQSIERSQQAYVPKGERSRKLSRGGGYLRPDLRWPRA